MKLLVCGVTYSSRSSVCAPEVRHTPSFNFLHYIIKEAGSSIGNFNVLMVAHHSRNSIRDKFVYVQGVSENMQQLLASTKILS